MTEEQNRELIRELLNLSDWALKQIGRPGMTGEGRKVAEHYANGGDMEMRGLGGWGLCKAPKFDAGDGDGVEYRIKQPTRTINGFEVPDCLREVPPRPSRFFVESLTNPEFYIAMIWYGDINEIKNLERGIAHATAENAAINAKARLGIDPYGEGEQQ